MYSSTLPSTSALERLVSTTPRPLYPQERDTVPVVHEAGWAPGPVWTLLLYYNSIIIVIINTVLNSILLLLLLLYTVKNSVSALRTFLNIEW